MLSLLLSMVTGLLLWFYGIRVAVWVFCLFFRHGKNSLKKYQDGSRPSWAIVTGATSGIGLAFCEELLSLGWNVIMISRSEEKLHSLQERLLDKFPTRAVEYFVWEASSVSSDSFQETFENLQEGHLEGKDVALLVNNVGTTENTFGWFADCDNSTRDENKLHADDLTRTITINCIFPAKLTAAIIPHLRARSHKYSAIINLSSILAHLPSPFNPIYGASKAFNRTFSRALAAEYAQLGIDVLCVSPGMVASNLTGFKNSTWFCTGARETAMYSLRALGLSIETFPHPIHGLTFLLTSILTTFIPQKWAATATALAMRFLPKPPGINVSRDFRKY